MRLCILVCLALLPAACELKPLDTAPPTAAAAPLPYVTLAAATATSSRTATPRPTERTSQATVAANRMRWETSGGGQITFDVTRNGPSYDVAVSSYQFEDRDEHFTITAESSAVYQAISTVMQDQGHIVLHTSNEPTGSWTTLQFRNGGRSW